MAHVLSILASLCICAVIVMYYRQVAKGHSTPNPATWLIWLVLGIMNAVSYFVVVRGNYFEWAITGFAAVGLSAIFYALRKGKFGDLGWTEIVCGTLCLLVGVVWKITGDAITANILLQVIYVISFIPTAFGLLFKDAKEKAPPWNLAVLAYTLVVIAIIIDWGEGSWLELVHPIANGIVGNGSIALIIQLKRD